jgi:hypothetical protein
MKTEGRALRMEETNKTRKEARAERMDARSRRLSEGLTYMWNWYEVPVAWRHDPDQSDETFRRSEAGHNLVVWQDYGSRRWRYRVLHHSESIWTAKNGFDGAENRPYEAMSKADDALRRLLDGTK